jgi:hypothetical protein
MLSASIDVERVVRNPANLATEIPTLANRAVSTAFEPAVAILAPVG